jgi:AcrR family transcriptional regulator
MRRNAKDKHNSKDKILDAALTVFSKHGFDGARTRDIAELAGVNIATLHYHFKSKDNIYGSVIEEIHKASGEQIMEVMIEQRKIIENSKNKKELICALKIMATTFLEMIINPKNKRFARIIAHEQIEQSKHFKNLFETVMKRVCEPFLTAIAKISEKRTNEIEAILITHSLHGILTSFLHNQSSLFYLSGWKSYDKNNSKQINKHISQMIDNLLKPYL